eukprot:TRINITY_DN7831_c0_g1_i1.p1 TRINITY_DN7831_c0_g1~~TRINITY_DN7831_c0_g1_i1.p1  ORF type:complete len:2512 (+),score=475.63 TRINITY_DN7831_c0_g1_i1:325-7860(+)
MTVRHSLFSNKKKSRTVDIIVNWQSKSHKLPLTDELHLRTKLSVLPNESLQPFLDHFNNILSPFMKTDDTQWTLLGHKNNSEEGTELDLSAKISSINFSMLSKERDIFLCDKKQVSKEKKRKRKNKGKVVHNFVYDSLISGETIFYQLDGFVTVGISCVKPSTQMSSPAPPGESLGSTMMLPVGCDFVTTSANNILLSATNNNTKEFELNMNKENLVGGTIYFTNYRIIFVEDTGLDFEPQIAYQQAIHVPLSTITTIERRKVSVSSENVSGLFFESKKKIIPSTNEEKHKSVKFRFYTLNCKDFRTITFAWEKQDKERKTFEKLLSWFCSLPVSAERFFLSNVEWKTFSNSSGWEIYDAKEELERQQGSLDEASWQVVFRPKTNLISQDLNTTSLPPLLILPKSVTKNGQIVLSSQFYRKRGRLPTYIWGSNDKKSLFYGCSLLRAERPKSVDETRELLSKLQDTAGGGLSPIRETENFEEADKKLLKLILESHLSVQQAVAHDGSLLAYNNPRFKKSTQKVSNKITILDVGDLNSTLEKEYSQIATFRFLSLPTKRQLLESYEEIFYAAVNFGIGQCDKFRNDVLTSNWLDIIRICLDETRHIVNSLLKSECVIIENDGKSSHDGILLTLTQLSCDSYYRTLNGFCSLIEKDWVQYSYRYSSELGNFPHPLKDHDKDKDLSYFSPDFLLLMNCVWEMWQKYPSYFQFSENLLVFILDCLYDNRFATFTCDSEEERQEFKSKMPSIWDYILAPHNIEGFTNSMYNQSENMEIPFIDLSFNLSNISVWGNYFIRHSHSINWASYTLEKVYEDSMNDFSFAESDRGKAQSFALFSPDEHEGSKGIGSSWTKRILSPRALDRGVGIGDTASPTSGLAITRDTIVSRYDKEGQVLTVIGLPILSPFTRDVMTMPQLTTLILQQTAMFSLPSLIRHLTSLNNLFIEDSYISKLIPGISNLTNLQSISLKGNSFSVLHPSIGKLCHLKSLNLSRNSLQSLPIEIGNLSELKRLKLSWNKISTLPDTIFEKMKNLEILELEHNLLTNLPSSLLSLEQLTLINANSNEILHLPDSFHNLSKLTHFNISSNKLTSLPDSVSHLSLLTDFNLSNNHLHNIPKSVGNLVNLANLDVSGNKLTCIPPTIGYCTSLLSINLSSNGIGWLPLSIRNLVKLESLDVSYNNLKFCTLGIGFCTSLTYLNLLHNDFLSELPLTLSNLSSTLRSFYHDSSYQYNSSTQNISLEKLGELSAASSGSVAANMIASPSSASLRNSSGVNSTLKSSSHKFLEQMKEIIDNKETVKRFRVMILGHEKVGKTSLAQGLLKREWFSSTSPFRVTSNRNGLTIRYCTFAHQQESKGDKKDGKPLWSFMKQTFSPNRKSPKKEKSIVGASGSNVFLESVHVDIWDFTCHPEVFQLSHQFFMTGRTVYLVLFNLTDPVSEYKIEFWLQSIKASDPNADVFIVGTHLTRDMNLEEVKQKLDSIKKQHRQLFPSASSIHTACVCATGAETLGLDELRSKISERILAHRKIKDQIPNRYLMLEQILLEIREHLKIPSISMANFMTLSNLIGISDIKEAKRALKLFSELGTTIYYDYPQLNNTVILEPRILIKTIQKLFDSSLVRSGTLQHSDCRRIWGSTLPPESSLWLVYLLRKFGISFELLTTELYNMKELFSSRSFSARSRLQSEPMNSPSGKQNRLDVNTTTGSGEKYDFSILIGETKKPSSFLEQALAKDYQYDKGVSLIPALLPTVHPDLRIVWPSFHADLPYKVYHIERNFQFASIPQNLFPTIIRRLLHLIKPLELWANGVLGKLGKSMILIEQNVDKRVKKQTKLISSELQAKTSNDSSIESTESSENQISLQTRSKALESSEEAFCTVMEIFDEILSKIQQPCKRYVRSPNSLSQKSLSPSRIYLDTLEGLVIRGESVITPDNEDPIPIREVAPDITLASYQSSGRVVQYQQLNDEYELQKIAEGGYAVVYKGMLDGQNVAVKKLKETGESSTGLSNGFREFRQEINVQARFSHPNVVNLMGICFNPFSIILEFVPSGNMFDFIHNYDVPILWNMKLRLARDLALGIQYLHGLTPAIIHNDMKSPNIMLASTDVSAPICAKVADFGLSKPYTGNPLTGRLVDLPVWLAPEILAGKSYDTAVDTYAYGVILWELITRRGYFEEVSFLSDVEEMVMKGERQPIPPCPTAYELIITKCWAQEPKDRPKFDWVLSQIDSMNNQSFQEFDEMEIEIQKALLDKRIKQEQERIRLEEEKKKQMEKENAQQKEWDDLLNEVVEHNEEFLFRKKDKPEEEEWMNLRDLPSSESISDDKSTPRSESTRTTDSDESESNTKRKSYKKPRNLNSKPAAMKKIRSTFADNSEISIDSGESSPPISPKLTIKEVDDGFEYAGSHASSKGSASAEPRRKSISVLTSDLASPPVSASKIRHGSVSGTALPEKKSRSRNSNDHSRLVRNVTDVRPPRRASYNRRDKDSPVVMNLNDPVFVQFGSDVLLVPPSSVNIQGEGLDMSKSS